MNLDRQSHAIEQLNLALLLLTAGLPDEALAAVQRSLALDPESSRARLVEAQIQVERHEPNLAIQALDTHDQYHPKLRRTLQVMVLRARALLRTNHDDLSRTVLQQLVRAFPDDARFERMLACLSIKQCNTNQAIEHLCHLIQLEPSDIASRHSAVMMLSEQDPQEAADLLSCAPGEPTLASDLLIRARLCQRVGRLRDAEDIYSQLLVEHRDDAELWLEAGQLADTMGADDLAISRLNRAVALDVTNDTKAPVALAKSHMHAGRLAAGGRWWWRIARQQGHDVQAWAGLIVCALATHRTGLAWRALATMSAHGTPAQCRKIIAELWPHAICGQVASHAAEDRTESEQTPLSPLLSLAARACATLEKHAQRVPGQADTHYHLAVCYNAIGDNTSAQQAINTSIQINPSYTKAKKLAQRLTA